MNELRISFIQASNDIDIHWNAPIGFGYLKSSLESHISLPLHVSTAETDKEAVAQAPHVVGISSFSQDFSEAVRIADFVKGNSDALVVLGGQHISAFPHTLPTAVDVGIIGEGECTFYELISAVMRETLPNVRTLAGIPGLVFRDNSGSLRMSEPREMIQPLDEIPIPDRTIGRLTTQRPYLFTSRGCPYSCTFCASSKYWKKLRMHSAARVVAEVEDMLRQFPDIGTIPIWDDLFISDGSRLREIVCLLEQWDLPRKVGFSCNVRANLVNQEICSLLKRANVTECAFGAESASERILKTLKGGVTVEQNQRALDLLKANDIKCGCTFVLGTPGETEDDIKATYEFILRNYREGKLNGYELTILTPMPGTKIWEWAESQGIVSQNMEWNRLRFLGSKSHNMASLAQWLDLRRRNKSIYLNEAAVPQERLFDLMLAYEDQRQLNSPRPEVVKLVPPLSRRVLDVGCATGALGNALKENGIPVVAGVELHRPMADTAASYLDQVIAGDVEETQLPFPDGYFDCLILADVLGHLRDPWSTIKSLIRYLADDCAVVCTVRNSGNLAAIKSIMEGHRAQGRPDGTRRHLSLAELCKLLSDAGFAISQASTIRDPSLSFPTIDPSQGALLDINMGRFAIKGISRNEFEELVAVEFLVLARKPRTISREADTEEESKQSPARTITAVASAACERDLACSNAELRTHAS